MQHVWKQNSAWPEIADIEPAHESAFTQQIYELFNMASAAAASQGKTVGKRRSIAVNYSQLNSLSSVVLYDTVPRCRGKFYEVERIIERRKSPSVSRVIKILRSLDNQSCAFILWSPLFVLKLKAFCLYCDPRATSTYLSGGDGRLRRVAGNQLKTSLLIYLGG